MCYEVRYLELLEPLLSPFRKDIMAPLPVRRGISVRGQPSYVFGPFRLDSRERVLYRGDAEVPLTPKAIEVLIYLASNPGRVVDKNELLRAVWPNIFVEENNLGQQIFQIRRALGQGPNGSPYIKTVP